MEDSILYIFLVILFIAGGLILIPELNAYDTSSWSFIGSSFLASLIINFAVVYLGICVGVLAVAVMDRNGY